MPNLLPFLISSLSTCYISISAVASMKPNQARFWPCGCREHDYCLEYQSPRPVANCEHDGEPQFNPSESVPVAQILKPKMRAGGVPIGIARTQNGVLWQILHPNLLRGMRNVSLVLNICLCNSNADLGTLDWWSCGCQ